MPNLKRKIFTEAAPLTKVLDSMRHESKVVFTNGCFDIIHAGHILYLEEAAKYGSQLIIGVNGDNSVTQLKGKDRPLNPLDDRMLVLAALEFVTFVIPFNELTPLNLIQQIKPDVLVKGGDYKIDEIVGSDFVLNNGGAVHSLSFIKGKSTSSIIDRIKSK